MRKTFTKLAVLFTCFILTSQFSVAQSIWNTDSVSIWNIALSKKVGIGTTTPAVKLNVYDQGSSTTLLIGNYPIPAVGHTSMFLGTSADKNGYTYIKSVKSAGTAWGNLILNQDGGNVGIGTTDPTQKLSVSGTISTEGWDAVLQSKNTSGKLFDLIGTYEGWDPAGIFIAGYNAYSGIGGRSATKVYIGSKLIVDLGTGNVGIGTTNPTQKLSVNGIIQAKEIVVNTGWSDFVFDNNYKLRPLTEVEQFVKTNKHLPEIPSQKEVEKNGVQLGDISSKLLMKIEELTLYMIEMKKGNETMRKENKLQNKELEKQKTINNVLMNEIQKLKSKQ